jgi:hypothetical protein
VPYAAARACTHPGCHHLVSNSKPCPEHSKEKRRAFDAARANDPTRKLYGTSRWLNFRRWFLANNPICLHLDPDTNEQCSDIAVELHHLKSPRDYPELFNDALNVVGLCRRHHHKAPGESTEQPRKYAAAITD